jgi:hypothetical protein
MIISFSIITHYDKNKTKDNAFNKYYNTVLLVLHFIFDIF